jgi:PAS domain S-box-containing protein
MTHTIPHQPLSAVDLTLFEATPGKRVVFLPDAPRFTIVAASQDMYQFLQLPRESFIGKSVFDAFPPNPADLDFTGHKNLMASLENVLQNKAPHLMERQRYDVPAEGNRFREVWWQNKSVPVLNESGEVAYIINTAEDITELVKAGETTEQLQGMEQAYNLLLQAPACIAIYQGKEHKVALANAGSLKLWNTTEDVIGRSFPEVYPGIKGQGIIELLDDVLNTGAPFVGYELPIMGYRDGKLEQTYFDVVFQPLFENGNEKPNGVFTLAHDVTEIVNARHQVDQATQEADRQKRLYETINASTPDLIYVFDRNYRFTYANKALFTMWGSTWEKSIGKGLLENGYEPWHAEMHEREIDKVIATGQPIRGEVSFPHATLGKRIYDYIFVPVFNEDGTVEAIAGSTRDITELRKADLNIRESEERFRNLADGSPMFVFIIDADPTAPVSYWNKTWLEYTGRTQEEAVGRAWDGILHPDDVPLVMSYYQPAFENRQPYFIPAVRVLRHDGVYHWHAFKGNPRYNSDGSFNGFIGVGLDIHEQKLGEERIKESESRLQQMVAERTDELNRTIEELRRSNTNLEEFAYAASHDIKEPIRKINFFSNRLKETLSDRLTPAESHAFSRMENAARRMSALVDDLLNYSQLSLSPKILEEVNLNGLIDIVLEDLDLEIEEKKAVVTVEQLGTINGHHRQLQQVFQNLISNALKYARPDKAPMVSITGTKVKGSAIGKVAPPYVHDRDYLKIAISDNGIGFDQEDAERIFNVFTRLHGNTEFRGTGIGLSIVRKVVENHHGFITAEGNPGNGAVFQVYLPLGIL